MFVGLPSSRFFFPATTGFVPVKSLKDLTESAKGVLPRGRCLVTAPAGSLCLTSRCKEVAVGLVLLFYLLLEIGRIFVIQNSQSIFKK